MIYLGLGLAVLVGILVFTGTQGYKTKFVSVSTDTKNVGLGDKVVTIDKASLSQASSTFEISGSASGVKGLLVVCLTDPTYIPSESDLAPGDTDWPVNYCVNNAYNNAAEVVNDRWSATARDISNGSYHVYVFDNDARGFVDKKPLAMESVRVKAPPPTSFTIFAGHRAPGFSTLGWDATTMYFIDTEPLAGYLDRYSNTINPIPNSDPNTFEVDWSPPPALVALTWPKSIHNGATYYRDAKQHYVIQVVTTGCNKDAQGCVASTGLIVQKGDGTFAYYGTQPQ